MDIRYNKINSYIRLSASRMRGIMGRYRQEKSQHYMRDFLMMKAIRGMTAIALPIRKNFLQNMQIHMAL